jgi:hypothetical protein
LPWRRESETARHSWRQKRLLSVKYAGANRVLRTLITAFMSGSVISGRLARLSMERSPSRAHTSSWAATTSSQVGWAGIDMPS